MTPARDMTDEPALLARSLRGDHEAFGRLVERYADQVLNVAYRMVGNRAEAEDLTQDTFLAAFKALPRFRAESKFSTWLYRIGVNKCKDWLKSKGHQVQELNIEGEPIDLAERLPDLRTPDRTLEDKELGALLDAAIATLPVWYRDAFVLKHVEGLDYEEISDIVGVGRDTLKMRVYKARVHLRRMLADLVESYPELRNWE
jgi:RNA polymerase sigma-70 factor, ECF subfamily